MHDTVADALGLLPAWFPWLGLVAHTALAMVLVVLVQGLTLSLFGPRLAWTSLHWTEIARRAWATRVALALTGVVLVVSFPVGSVLLLHGETGGLGSFGHGLVVLLGVLTSLSFVGRVGGRRFALVLDHRTDPRGRWAYMLLSRGHLLLLIGISAAVPVEFGLVHLGAFGLVVSLNVLWVQGFGLRLARGLGRVVEAPRFLADLVARVESSVGTEAGRVEVLRWQRANAFVFPSTGALAFTTGALEALNDRQLEAVCAHELGHLAEGDSGRRLRLLLALSVTPLVLLKPVSATWSPMAGGALVVLIFLVLTRGRRWILAREEDADAVAHEHDHDDSVYAAALEALYRHNLAPAVLGRGRTHPDLYDRLLAAGSEPDFPRPAPPKLWPGRVWAAAVFGFVVVPFVTGAVFLRGVPYALGPAEAPLLAVLSVGGGHGADTFETLAYAAEDREDWWRAGQFWRAALAYDPTDPDLRASVAMADAREGRCSAAQALVDATFAGPPGAGLPRARHSDEGLLQAVRASLEQCERYGAIVSPPEGSP